LGLGILMGSVVLDQQIVKVLERDLGDLRRVRQELQDDVITLERQVEANMAFADTAEEWLVEDALESRDVLVLRIDGTDDRVADGATSAIEAAGGRIAGSVVLTDDLSLREQTERDQLALSVESASGDASELRSDAGDFLGTRLAGAVSAGEREGRVDAADNAAVNLLVELEENGFVELDGIEEGQGIPTGELVLLGGSSERRPFNLADFVSSFGSAVASRGVGLVVAESSESNWGVVAAVRSDEAASEVATVDHAESIAGRIAVALALRDAASGITDHYGTGPGSTAVIPRPTPEN
jgi:hypothetical protein